MAEQTEVEWETCEQAGCIGIRLVSARMCLAHASEQETAAALMLVGQTGAIDARGVPITRALLKRILTAAPRATFSGTADFRGATFSGGAGFDGATFSSAADFRGASFSDGAVFERATFHGNAEFSGATFSGDAWFARATFSGGAMFRATFHASAGFDGAVFSASVWFNEATFHASAGFGRATFGDSAHFVRAAFNGSADFRGATFSGGAGFGQATFSGPTWFLGARFSGPARFDGAAFSDIVTFGRAVFSGGAEFGGAMFSGPAGFGAATFSGAATFLAATFSGSVGFVAATFNGNVEFGGATFSGDAEFSRATFSGPAEFGRATFSGPARFEGAIFKRRAEFASVRFERARQFGPLLAYRGLVLDEVQFAQPVQIEVSSTGLCCRGAQFPGGVQFRLRWTRVVLDDTDLAAPSILTGIPHLSGRGKELALREEQIARAWQRLLENEISERPQLLSLQRANVAGLGLSNVSAADCQFAGAHNLDKLRLESDVSFATAPSPVAWRGRRWGGREVIAEERAWRAHRSRRYWVAPRWPGWLDDQRPRELDPGQIAGLYRALRKGREDVKDEPGAADFYYGEMEMRRYARSINGSNPGGQSGATSRGRVERGILTAYWLVSGYGLRAWRAAAGLAAVIALFAVAFHLAGFAVPPRPVSYWTSLLYAFRATLSLTDDEVRLTAWGKLLQGVLRLTGPVLLGLALLALRGRVKR